MTIVNRQKGRAVATVIRIVIDEMKRFVKCVLRGRGHADKTFAHVLFGITVIHWIPWYTIVCA